MHVEGVVLGEYTPFKGNFQAITRLMLSRISEITPRMSYVYDENVMHHFLFSNNLCYVGMSLRETPYEFVYSFLESLAVLVKTRIPKKILLQAKALSLNEFLAPLLKKHLEYWNSLQPCQNPTPELRKIKGQIAEIRDVMVQNIDKLLIRQEKIQLLLEKTEELHQDAFQFERQASTYYRRVWWKRQRWILLFYCVILVIRFEDILHQGFRSFDVDMFFFPSFYSLSKH